MTDLGRRLVAYTIIAIAAVVIVWFLFRTVVGFMRWMIAIALFLAAIYAIFWALSFRRGSDEKPY